MPDTGEVILGKIGLNNLLEKDINLAITEKVKKCLEKEKIAAELTRKEDKGLGTTGDGSKKTEDMQARVKMINETKPVLTVSIHQNSYEDPEIHGAQVFYYSHSREGEAVAKILQESLQEIDPENHRQAKANETYYLLRRTKVPTVIVECGFLTNPEEAEKLSGEEYQEQVAEAVAKGIAKMSGIPERVWKLKLPCHVDNAIMKHMETIIKKIDRNQIDQEIMEEAGSILKNGGLVAFPTETVYGLGANALDEEAAKKTYAAKGRPSDNPLIVHIARLEDLGAIVESVPLIVDEIAAHFWPGPLTMIFNKNEKVPLGTTGGLETVAVRMPDDEIARELILAGGGYVSAPSANTSGRPSPTTAQHVAEDLSGKIEMILDGGSVDIGLESTILDMTVFPPMILRPGAITADMLEEVIGVVSVDETILGSESSRAPKAPGMKYRHYAPKAKLTIVEGSLKEEVFAIRQLAYEKSRQGVQVGIIGTNETVEFYTHGLVKISVPVK